MSCLLFRLNSRLEKDTGSAAPTPHPLTIQAPPNDKKINETMPFASPSLVFHTKFTISVLKSK